MRLVGCLILKFHNKGFASEAALAVLKFGFEKMRLHRIIATCQPENTPSYRVMEKIGMRREGYFKKCIPHGNEWWDEYYYAILREEREWINVSKLKFIQRDGPPHRIRRVFGYLFFSSEQMQQAAYGVRTHPCYLMNNFCEVIVLIGRKENHVCLV